MREFVGRTAFVTGGASGIGLGLVEAFLAEGMNVVLADVEPAALERAASGLARHANRIRTVRCDVSSRASFEAAAAEAITAFGRVHVVCNNAGVGGGGPLGTVTPAEWNWVLGVNLMGVVHGISIFLPHIEGHGEGGHFVNTASMAGMRGSAMMGPYCASKAAVVSITETLAAELQGSAIGASVLCPGWVKTRIHESRRNMPAEVAKAIPTGTTPPPAQAARVAEIVRLVETGMDVAEVAQRTLGAIRAGDLYVFTHPDMRPRVDERFGEIGKAFDTATRFGRTGDGT